LWRSHDGTRNAEPTPGDPQHHFVLAGASDDRILELFQEQLANAEPNAEEEAGVRYPVAPRTP
jgi:hypothetical protein